jgi:hypothetical protein
MNIAVIGDYTSPKYKDLLQLVKCHKPEETLFDLSRHQTGTWVQLMNKRFADISNSHMVLIGQGWKTNFDMKRDITQAQALHKECLVESDGKFIPFPTGTYSDYK